MSHDMETLNAKALELLPALKKELQKDIEALADSGICTDEHLLMFLRWKPKVKRAAERFRAHIKWRKENPQMFGPNLRLSKDPEMERVLLSEVVVAPTGLKTKKSNCPMLIGRLRNNDMTDGRTVDDVCRMLLYTMDRVLQSPEMQMNGVVILHDLKGVDKSKNLHVDIPKKILGAIIGHFPVRISGIYIWNAPFWFPTFFKMVGMVVLPSKIRQRMHFISSLEECKEELDQSMLIPDMGGNFEFSCKEWVELQKVKEAEDSFQSLTDFGPKE